MSDMLHFLSSVKEPTHLISDGVAIINKAILVKTNMTHVKAPLSSSIQVIEFSFLMDLLTTDPVTYALSCTLSTIMRQS